MKLLISDKEILDFLINMSIKAFAKTDLEMIKSMHFDEVELMAAIYWVNEKKHAGTVSKFKPKILGKLQNAVEKDLKNYLNKAKEQVLIEQNRRSRIIRTYLPQLIETIGKEKIFEMYALSEENGFVKTIGQQIDKNSILIKRNEFNSYKDDCLLRNTGGVEDCLVTKIDNSYPFWFIDSGYTNFLEGKHKKWHRITRNHIHQFKPFEAPVDRLKNFVDFPRQWRTRGDTILVIEPGNFCASIFHIDIEQWKKSVEQELRKYTDKKIKFREKINKKNRSPLYQELLNDDYYCVININSNAATESIWAGVPVITLDRHITNSVSRNKLSDINDLYRPHLANWLCMLSYSQFTYEELMDGTALRLVKQYHV